MYMRHWPDWPSGGVAKLALLVPLESCTDMSYKGSLSARRRRRFEECTYNAIVTGATLAKVVVLEVVGRLREAVTIQVVRYVHNKKRDHAYM